MKIKRTVTFNVTEEEIRNFFDEDWWMATSHVGEDEFNELKDSLVDGNDYCGEEWDFIGDSKEEITKIWQEELEKVKKPWAKIRLKNLKEQLEYYKREMEDNKKRIEDLEKAIADAE